ncbi:MAG TPA: hypothetical protein VGM80_11710 [Gaiellaceae bacterium]|jgi:hypothetical protein
MSKGPLSVRWDNWTLAKAYAGTVSFMRVELENTGSATWGDTIRLAYHWLDDRDNPIVWDGERTPLPLVAPGERVEVDARVRAPIPPGLYRFAPDLVVEHRAWFSQLGSEIASREVEVRPREGVRKAELPDGVEPSPEWEQHVAAAHAEGYGVVAGSIRWQGSIARRAPKELEPYKPGSGRVSSFPHPLICPSVLTGIELERLPDIAGLPAFAAPRDEPWIFDGRAVLRVRASARRG